MTDQEKLVSVLKHANKSENNERLKAMIELAKPESKVICDINHFDSDPLKINVSNGTIDLASGELLSHNPNDYISKLIPIEYDPNARCKTWNDFLCKIFKGDRQLINFIQKIVGYSLTGLTSEQKIFIFVGSGANGKSVFTETIKSLFGEYAMTTQFNTFSIQQINSVRNDLAGIKGARLVTACESDQEYQLSEAIVKQLTGGDKVTARFLYKEFFEYIPTYKIFLVTNHKPIIKDQSHSIWRRIIVIPFDVTIPSEKQNHNLINELKEELPGILNWAVKGCLKWQRSKLEPPEIVRLALKEYKDDMDTIQKFIEDECIVGNNYQVTFKDLYYRYKAWCNGFSIYPYGIRKFGDHLVEKGFKRGKIPSGDRGFNGLKVKIQDF